MAEPLDEEQALRRFFAKLTSDSAEDASIQRTVASVGQHEFAARPHRRPTVRLGQITAAAVLVTVALGLLGWRAMRLNQTASPSKTPLATPSHGVHGNWIQASPRLSPSGRAGFGMTYDARNNVVVLFGGYSGKNAVGPTGVLSDTWVWDGLNWSRPETNPTPAARAGASMVFDAARDNVVLFGGSNGPSQLNLLSDTWTWDGRSWTLHHPSMSPPARTRGAMTYDPRTRLVILFGGQSASGWLADTWAWNGTTWTDQKSTVHPEARSGASFEYDQVGQVLVLTGGLSATGLIGDTWSWDGQQWRRLTPPTQVPGRFASSFARDRRSRALILFGGSACMSGGCGPNDTWAWNGTAWIEVPTASPPSYRYEAGLALSPSADSLVLFGGRNGSDFLQDTWVWSPG